MTPSVSAHDTQEERADKNVAAHVHPWLIHVNVWQKTPQYCKVISLQLKFKK